MPPALNAGQLQHHSQSAQGERQFDPATPRGPLVKERPFVNEDFDELKRALGSIEDLWI